MKVRRLSESSEASLLRGSGGFVLNVGRSMARIHRVNCATIMWMNYKKHRGVFYASTIEKVWEWLMAEKVEGRPCRLCLQSMSYTPRPEKLIDRIKQMRL